MNFSYKKELHDAEEWVKRSRNQKILHDLQITEIRDLLSEPFSLDTVVSISLRLNRLSIWYSHTAICGVITALPEQIYRWCVFMDYIRLSLKLRVASIEAPDGIGTIEACEVQRHFILMLGANIVDESIWLGRIIYDSIKQHLKHPLVCELGEISISGGACSPLAGSASGNSSCTSVSAFSESPLCGFVLRMWFVLTGRRDPTDRLPDKAPQCGIYDALFDQWNHPEKLAQSISVACDFHILRMKEDRRIPYDIAEFDISPFRQIPFEILAYRNLRRHLGLETPFPSHPLLESPFVRSLPEIIAPSGDPLLARVLAYTHEILSE